MEGSGSTALEDDVLQTQGKEQSDGEQMQCQKLQMEGKEVYRHIVPWRGKTE